MLHPKALPKTSGAFIAQRVMSATDPDNVLFRGGDPDFMTSLARGLHVIRAFAGVDRRLALHRDRSPPLLDSIPFLDIP